MVDVPVVAAARLKGDVVDDHLLGRDRSEVALADEVLRVGVVRLSDRENHFLLEGGLGVGGRFGSLPDVLGEAEGAPGVGPARVEADVGEKFGNFRAGDAVLLGEFQMVHERRVDDPLRDERRDGDHAAVVGVEARTVPNFAEEDVVVVFGKLRREIAELGAARRLGDLFGGETRLREAAGNQGGAEECGFAFGCHETSPLRDPWWGRLHFRITSRRKPREMTRILAHFSQKDGFCAGRRTFGKGGIEGEKSGGGGAEDGRRGPPVGTARFGDGP